MFEIRDLVNGKEYSVLEFDNIMVMNGYYSEYDSFDMELLDSECIVYIHEDDYSVRIEFEVTDKSDDIENTYITVKDVQIW